MEPGDELNQSVPDTEHAEDGAGTAAGGDGGETWQDAGPEGEPAGGKSSDQTARAREAAQRWVGQLQEMIDHAGQQAGPVLRDVAAKAAELAAVAAENAGPIARKAANVTEHVGDRLAVRSKELASELRRAAETDRAARAAGGAEGTADEVPGEPGGHDDLDAGGPDGGAAPTA